MNSSRLFVFLILIALVALFALAPREQAYGNAAVPAPHANLSPAYVLNNAAP